MAATTTPTELQIAKWKKDAWLEFNRKDLFAPYKGRGNEGMNAIIHECYENRGRGGGEKITIPLLAQLAGAGQSGNSTLQGNEEALDQHGHEVTTSLKRNAVLLDEVTMQQSAYDQMNSVRPLLTNWMANEVRDDTIQAMGSIDGVNYGTATAGQRNTWAANNVARLLYGADTGHHSGTHATDLAKLTVADDKMSASITQTIKRKLRGASPAVRPVKVDGGREYFVMFHGWRAFRDLKNDTVIQNANREARARDVGKNPLFQDGDLIYDGIIHVEVPEIDTLLLQATAGATGTPVAPSFLCGAQALAHAYSQMPKPTERKEDDYGLLKGRGIQGYYGISKIIYNGARSSSNNVDWGMGTVWVSAPAD